MKNLVIIALVAVFAAAAFAVPQVPSVPWQGQEVTVNIPVYMDIKPVAQLILNGSEIKLEPVEGTVDYVGVADPMPMVKCNVPVTVTGLIIPAAPLVAPNLSGTTGLPGWGISLQGAGNGFQPANWAFPSQSADYDPAYMLDIGADPVNGVGVPVAVLLVSPDLTQREQGDKQRVATVELTVKPR
jgi:hypothetical protein